MNQIHMDHPKSISKRQSDLSPAQFIVTNCTLTLGQENLPQHIALLLKVSRTRTALSGHIID